MHNLVKMVIIVVAGLTMIEVHREVRMREHYSKSLEQAGITASDVVSHQSTRDQTGDGVSDYWVELQSGKEKLVHGYNPHAR